MQQIADEVWLDNLGMSEYAERTLSPFHSGQRRATEFGSKMVVAYYRFVLAGRIISYPMRLTIGTLLVLILTVASSLADPAGTYRVSGTNPGSGSTYSGTVTVERNGETFLVTWTVAGGRQIGVGIGKDDLLAVSYRSGNAIGIALYLPDQTGGWKGIWAPIGSQTLGTEI